MAVRLLRSLHEALLQFEAVYITPILWRRPPPPELLIPVVVRSNLAALQQERPPSQPFDLKEIFDGFLWGAPTFRRSVERRMMRKYGAENWETGKKLIPIRKDLKPCVSCGHFHEDGRLCRKYLRRCRTYNLASKSDRSFVCFFKRSQLLRQDQSRNDGHAREDGQRAGPHTHRQGSGHHVRRGKGTARRRVLPGGLL